MLQCESLQHIPHSSLANYLSNHKFNASFLPFSATTSASFASSLLWHARLGHPSDIKLKALGHNIPSLQFFCNKACHICLMAKLKRLPFPFTNKICVCAFDLVHMDVWGPYSIPTLDGYKYFLTIVDDATQATWLFLMKSKSDVRNLFQSFYTMVATQFSQNIKAIRTDNAKEFVMSDFFSSHGIIHQTSCVYIPQQNAVVERKHQHLLFIARALQIQSQVPLSFWGNCVLTATYLINRLPSPLLNDKTPFELLFHKPPKYNHLKVFGCLCFASTIAHTRNKFSPRARRCVFLGYLCNVKGYKLYDLDTYAVFVSKDVVFHESIFPFVPSSNNSIPFNSLPLPCASFVPPLHDDPLLFKPKTSALTPHSIIQVHHTIDDDFLDEVPEAPLDPIANPIPLRRSVRSVKRLFYLQEFHCNHVAFVQPLSSSQSGTSHPLSSHVSYHHLSPSYKTFCCAISSLVEPQFYYQAMSDPQWQAAMATEIAALEANNTWTLTPLPTDKKSIGCKWVYKIKYKADGSIKRYKATKKGFTQKEGIDYFETFSPVAKMVSVKVLLAIASIKGWFLSQLDVK